MNPWDADPIVAPGGTGAPSLTITPGMGAAPAGGAAPWAADPIVSPSAPSAVPASAPDDSWVDPEGTGQQNYSNNVPDGSTIGSRAKFALDATIDGIPFSDRLAAGENSLLHGGSYAQNLSDVRARMAARSAQDPTAEDIFSTIGSSVLPAGAVGDIVQGAGVGAKVARGVATGGVLGGVQGASSSPDLTNAAQTAADTGLGAAAGATVGGGLPVLGAAAGGAYRMGANAMLPRVPGLGQKAQDFLVQALQADGAGAVDQRLASMGNQAMPVDAGRNLLGVGQGLAAKPGAANSALVDALNARNSGAMDRMSQSVNSNLGPAPTSPQALTDALNAQRGQLGREVNSTLASHGPVDISPVVDNIGSSLSGDAVGPNERSALGQAHGWLTKEVQPPTPPAPPLSGQADIPDMTEGLGAPPPQVPNPDMVAPPSINTAAPPRPTGPAPQSLLSFLAKNGGVNDAGGDLASSGMKAYPGLIRQSGMPLDQARRMAAEAGYLGGDTDGAMAGTSVNDLLDAMGQHPRYSVHDGDAVAARQAFQDFKNAPPTMSPVDQAASSIKQDLLDSGLPESQIDPTRLQSAAMAAAHGGVPIEDAWERAAMAPSFPGDTPLPGRAPAPETPAPVRAPIDNALAIHRTKQDFDQLISYGNPGLGINAVGNQEGPFKAARGGINDALRNQVPGYADNMDASSGIAKGIEQLEQGTKDLSSSRDTQWPADYAQQYAGLPPLQQMTRAYGQRASLEAALGTKSNELAALRTLMQGPEGADGPRGWNAQKLATSFGDQPVANVNSDLANETQFQNSRNEIAHGSQTATRGEWVKALQDPKFDVKNIPEVKETTALGAMLSVPRAIANPIYKAFQRPVDNTMRDLELARAISTQGQSGRDILAAALQRHQGQQASQGVANAVTNRAAVAGALLAPQPARRLSDQR